MVTEFGCELAEMKPTCVVKMDDLQGMKAGDY
jgi:hypothetical protein